MYSVIDRCVCCGSGKLVKYIDFGGQHLVNNLGNPDKYELAVNYCEMCTHSQLTIAVDKNILFSNYLYKSDCVQHREIFQDFSKRCKGKTILDIGCNDGTLLEYFDGWDRYGIDPARNLWDICEKKGIKLLNKRAYEVKADVVTLFNVLAHTHKPEELLGKALHYLADNGTVYVLVSQKNMLDNGEFDTIYHEHFSYFNITSFGVLCKNSGLYLDAVEVSPMHGGSYLFTLKKYQDRFKKFDTFGEKVKEVKERFLAELEGKKNVVGYGASAKGINALNFFGVQPEYIVDDNELKQGYRVCGAEIVPSERLAKDDRDLTVIVLAWNMYDYIVEKVRKLRGDRDKYVRVF